MSEAMKQTPASIIRAALEPALRNGIADNRTTRILDALRNAGWGFFHASALKAQGWQPIEGAPKDGRELILGDEHEAYAGFYNDGAECRRGKAGWFAEMDRGSLLTAKNVHPTHFMHLPVPSAALASPERPEPVGQESLRTAPVASPEEGREP